MFYYLAKATAPNNVVFRTSETDCLIIALGCYQFLDQSSKIWVEAGTSNTHHYVSVNQIHSALGESLCKALLHIMPSLVAIIIVRLTERVKWGHWNSYKNNEAMSAFTKLGHELHISEDTIYKMDKFVCTMSNKKYIYHQYSTTMLIYYIYFF